VTDKTALFDQCRKPTGRMGRFTLWRMNWSHSRLTDWGLAKISIEPHGTILDVGCGGGRTVSKLAAIATQGQVCGIDYSDESVAVSQKTNARWIDVGRVEIRQGSVSQLPFPDDVFDLVTAVETHYFWPDLAADTREVFRVLKPGGALILIAEAYKGAKTAAAKLAEKYFPVAGMTLLSVDEHRELFTTAGCSDVRVVEEPGKGWICSIGRKPPKDSAPDNTPEKV
jgi:ubiquinone/menaquinone biosynthesis C-methylase UbiE